MHSLYSFHFLDTISEQLQEKLENLDISPLTEEALNLLAAFETENRAWQGVYLLYYEGAPVYLGKADDVSSRLKQHLWKLKGRQKIDLSAVGYKALLLDKSMSTAANETVLIGLFKRRYNGMWNGKGFGSKDPGKERDTTRPGPFDSMYPIIANYSVEGIDDEETLASLLIKMKNKLPYTAFRFELGERSADSLALAGVPRTADVLLQAAINKLGKGWKGVILSYGMIIYKTSTSYQYGTELIPQIASDDFPSAV